jgi:hypothetical protein
VYILLVIYIFEIFVTRDVKKVNIIKKKPFYEEICT